MAASGRRTAAPGLQATPPEATPPEYRIDELARRAGTTVRNVRAYQDRNLLPPPRREGRVGLYAESHLGRLRLIGQMLARGYSLANIGELVAGWEAGRDLSELLGLESALFAPWSEEGPSRVARADIEAFLGDRAASELLDEAAQHGLVRLDGDGVEADNPRLIEGAAVLVDAGVPVRDVLDLGIYLAEAVDAIAARYVDLVERHVFGGDSGVPSGEQLPRATAVIRQLRPLAKQVLDAELALALERRIRSGVGARMAGSRRDQEGLAAG